jgi:hypothetical protein
LPFEGIAEVYDNSTGPEAPAVEYGLNIDGWLLASLSCIEGRAAIPESPIQVIKKKPIEL